MNKLRFASHPLILKAVILGTLMAGGQATAIDLVIFGDSLSDPGNAFYLNGELVRAPYEVVPSAPYAIGGGHLSNGRVWAERLPPSLVPPRNGKPALKRPRRFTNYAFQGARARANAPTQPLFDVVTQVNGFLSDFRGSANPNRTYVIFVGGNDARDALVAGLSDPGQVPVIVGAAVTAIADAVQTLWASGATEFVVMNAPNLAVVPAVRFQGPAAIMAGQQISMSFNEALSGALDGLEAALPNLNITRVDIFTRLNDVVANPGDFGIEDAENPCLTFGVVGGAVCARPHRRLFWDGIHPTSGGHRVVRDIVLEALAAP